MELEQLKDLWQKEPTPVNKQDEYLRSLLNKRSNSPIAKMKRNLRLELIAVIVLYGLSIVYYMFAFEGKMVVLSWFMLVIAVLFIVYYYRKNKLLKEMQCVSCQVKSNLKLQLKTLEKYVRFYLIAGNVLFPLSMVVVGYVTLIVFPGQVNPGATLFNSPDVQRVGISYVVVMSVLSVFIFFLNKMYVNRLYGRHIKRLKDILAEMNEDEG
jgi:4-hydroxybenzoate polyprenyltransferase